MPSTARPPGAPDEEPEQFIEVDSFGTPLSMPYRAGEPIVWIDPEPEQHPLDAHESALRLAEARIAERAAEIAAQERRENPITRLHNVPIPELDRQRAVMPNAHVIGDFLDWLRAEEIVLGQWHDNEDGDNELFPITDGPQRLLERYFDIDPMKIDAERRALLDALREAQA